jgi:2-alkenal reductase
VVGVTAAIESAAGSSAGIGFAIPSAIVQRVVPALITTGHFDHPYLGISGATMVPSIAQAMGLPANQRGALVASVTPNGPAAKAGLRGNTQPATVNGAQTRVGGDVITAIDGKTVKTFDDIVAYLANSTKINQTVTLTILRDGKEQKIQVTLAARPGSAT